MVAYLLTLKQKEGEPLRDYMTHFNGERLSADGHKEYVVLTALLGGVWPYSSFMRDLAMNHAQHLQPYFQVHRVQIFTNQPLRKTLSKPKNFRMNY